MKQLEKVMLAMFALILLLVVLAFPAMADSYSSRVSVFLGSESQWRNGVSWGQIPPKSTSYKAVGCAAYAADFAHETWASHPFSYKAHSSDSGDFTNPSEIRDGDVINIYDGVAQDANGNWYQINPHFYCVIQKKANGSLYTAEGAFSEKVRVEDGAYTVNNAYAGRKYFKGWHNPNYEPYVPNQVPNGYFDSVTSAGTGRIRVTGWAKDPDTPNTPIAVHVYVGGEANPNVHSYSVIANKYRSDVGNCAFDATIPVTPYGTQKIYVYAIDSTAGGYNPLLNGSPRTVTIERDTEAPVISNIQITDVSWKGYTVTCDVSDNVKVDKVAFPTWTINDGQDDIINDWANHALGTISGGKATYRVNTADHGKQTNCVYRTHIYAYDVAGNSVSAGKDVDVPSPITNVKVTDITKQGYTVSCDVDTAWNIQRIEFPTWTENNEQDDLIWHTGTVNNGHATFTVRTSDHNNEVGCYYITHIYVFDSSGKSASVNQRQFEELRVRVPANLVHPKITKIVQNGNIVHLEWTESPLIDAEDVRSYTIRANYMYLTPTLEITDIHALSADIDLSSFAPGTSLAVVVYAVNDTTGDESGVKPSAAYSNIDPFYGELEPVECVTMNDGETMTWQDWIVRIFTEHQYAVRVRMQEFEITSSDPSVVSVIPGEGTNGAKSLVAHKPGEVTLTLEFVNQPNTRRTTVLQVLPSENTVMYLPAGLKVIEDEAFMGTTLKNIALPEGCTTIGSRSFAGNSALKKIYIPASVTSIEFDAFEGCDNLTIYAPNDSRAIKMALALNLPYEISE